MFLSRDLASSQLEVHASTSLVRIVVCRFVGQCRGPTLKLSNHKIEIECDVLRGDDELPDDAPVVTINPFVPSLYKADSLDFVGGMPTLTLVQILGEEVFLQFQTERHQALETSEAMWPQVRKLFEYYLQGNAKMFARVSAKEQFGLEWGNQHKP